MHAEVERRCCGAAAAVQAAQVQSLALFCFYDREIACIGIESSRFFFFFLNGLCGPKPVAQRGKQEARNTKANFVGAHLCFCCPPSKQRHREASRQKLPFFKISIKTERKRGQRRQCEIVFPFLDSFGRRNEPKQKKEQEKAVTVHTMREKFGHRALATGEMVSGCKSYAMSLCKPVKRFDAIRVRLLRI